MAYRTSDFRNVALLGHRGVGKTALTEAMLFDTGAIDRLGRIEDGNTTLDYDPEEAKIHVSINMALAPIEWLDKKINLLDTPGDFDFIGEKLEALQVADSALIVMYGDVVVGTEKSWQLCDKYNLPRIILMNKMNDENGDFDNSYGQIKEHFGKSAVALQLPIRENGKLVGYIDTVKLIAKNYNTTGESTQIDLPEKLRPLAEDIHASLCEVIAESDDALMEKFFAGEEFTTEEILGGLKKSINSLRLAPVLVGSSYDNVGIRELINYIVRYMPSPNERGVVTGEDKNGEPMEIVCDHEAPTSAFIFKTIADPFIGKLSLFKVFSGSVKSDMTLINARNGSEEKITQIFGLRGKKQLPRLEIIAGDIGAVAKLSQAVTGDTLCNKSRVVSLPRVEFPKPQLKMAVVAKKKGDEEKIAQGLIKLMEEDKTFTFGTDKETGEMIICGTGDQHLDIISNKLLTKYGVGIDLVEPKLAYRETITKKVKVQGKHKKQSGGHGQFGDVWIEFEPGVTDELEFSEQVFGGSVPKNFFPAVEKGLQDCVKKGVLAGYPVVKLKATLVDGSYHPVDSSEMAFKVAASLAYKAGMAQAGPKLLEPVLTVKVYVPEKYMGDVMGDLSKRRGRVLGMSPTDDGLQEIIAEVPAAEMCKYATDLRSMTQARGSFDTEFARYEEVPENIAAKIIEEAKKNMTDDE